MTERFRRLDYGTLEIEVTVDDPKGVHEAVDCGEDCASG